MSASPDAPHTNRLAGATSPYLLQHAHNPVAWWQYLLDLDYGEDSSAEVDANFVMTGDGSLIEVQGSAEGAPFARQDFLALLDLAAKGVRELLRPWDSEHA